MMFKTLFKDEKHLREVVAESRSRLKVALTLSGNQTAAARVNSCTSESAWLSDHATGIGYYNYLVRLDENFEEEKVNLVKGCEELVRAIFKKENLLVSCTCTDKNLDAVKEAMPGFLSELDKFGQAKDTGMPGSLYKYVPETINRKEAFTTPGEVQYVALGGTFGDVADVDMGVLNVVQHLLKYGYLWNEIRVKGGAYGAGCNFTREKQWYFTSYRDPNLEATLDVYKNTAAYLENFEADEREVTKAVIGTISGIDTPRTPSMKGNRSMAGYFRKVSY